MELGRWEQAHEALDRVFRASEMGHPYGRFEAAPIKAELLLRQGRCEQARQLLEAMLPEYEARNELFMVLPALAPVRLACGDHAGALSALDTTIAPVRGRAARLWGLGLLCRGIEVYRGLGREEQALALLPEFVALAESSESLVAPAMLADTEGYTEGTQGHHAAAAEQFQRAATAWQRIGTPYQEARSRRFRAVSLLRSGGRAMREEARGELATAREICTRLAAPRELAAIATVARQHGLAARPAASAPDHDHRLTRREREVAALIARGASNRAIAQALFLSEKTVETHVSNILGKLAFTSRAQVAAYAVEQGLAGAGSS
jgi:DNA-binding CsgD family transcriptional regulator